MNIEQLQKLLDAARQSRQSELREKFNRSLPFADAMFDRWQRAKELGFGSGSSIYDSSVVIGDVTVGENTWIGPWTLLDGAGGGLSIGSYCSISSGVHIYTHDTVAWAISGGRAPARKGAVEIESQVYIGAQCVVAFGVKIGHQAVVAANSFVNRDVGNLTVFAGTPAVKIGEVEVDGESVKLHFGSNDVPPDLQGLGL